MADFMMTIEGNDARVDPVSGSRADPRRGRARRAADPLPDDELAGSSSGDGGGSSSDSGDDGGEAPAAPLRRRRGQKRPRPAAGFAFNPDSDDGGGNNSDDDWYDKAETSSWDFTGAIKRLEKEAAKSGAGPQTSVDEKIRRLRERRGHVEKANTGGQKSSSSGGDSDAGSSSSSSSDHDSDNDNATDGVRASGAASSSDSDSDSDDDDDNDDDDDDDDDTASAPQTLASRRAALRGGASGTAIDDGGTGSFFADEGTARAEAEAARVQERGSRKSNSKAAKAKRAAAKLDKNLSFRALNLSRPLIRATMALGFKAPTPIQARAIPLALAGRDLCCNAMTGSGKTAAFLLPVLERLLYRPKREHATRVLVVTPTRELATQCHSMLQQLGQFTDIRSALVVGGLSVNQQEVDLRTRPDVVICTPGRMIDLVRNGRSIHLEDVEILILDEADRLLELGFTDELEELVSHTPVGRQTLLFSATMTTAVGRLSELSLKRPVKIQVDALLDCATRLRQEFVRVTPALENDREALLLALCSRNFKRRTIVFFPQKWQAHRMKIVFALLGLNAGELHGDMPQASRLAALQAFRDEEVDFLMTTNVAARGLDIPSVETVINFEFPRELSTYVHRVGRTARAGRTGVSVTLVGERKRHLMKEAVKRAKQNVKARTIPTDVVAACRTRIGDIEGDVKAIRQQEAEEKALRIAEMEANRSRNMIEHEDDIQNRPKRTWFQTQEQKRLRSLVDGGAAEAQEAQKAEEERRAKKLRRARGEKGDAKKPHRLSRKKRRRLQWQMEAEKEEKRARREAAKNSETGAAARAPVNPLAQGMAKQAVAARQQKKTKPKHPKRPQPARPDARAGST